MAGIYDRSTRIGDVRALLEAGADPNPDVGESSTVMWNLIGGYLFPRHSTTAEAGREENRQLMHMLVSSGFDINRADREGNTALHTAAHRVIPHAISHLLDFGAVAHLRDSQGKLPRELLEERMAGAIQITEEEEEEAKKVIERMKEMERQVGRRIKAARR